MRPLSSDFLVIPLAAQLAAYTPFYYFDLNVRFLNEETNTLATPEPFRSAYPSTPNGVLHLPGIAAYAGFSFRRSLIDPIHNTTPLFMRGSIVPFGQWMLEPIQHDGEFLDVEVDPWNATKVRPDYLITRTHLTLRAEELIFPRRNEHSMLCTKNCKI